jgi:hypothetical protein
MYVSKAKYITKKPLLSLDNCDLILHTHIWRERGERLRGKRKREKERERERERKPRS